MTELPSPFCPQDCLFNGVPKMCNKDCQHSRDVVFKSPQSAEIKQQGLWKKTNIIGRTDNKVYLEDKTTVAIDSPLLK